MLGSVEMNAAAVDTGLCGYGVLVCWTGRVARVCFLEEMKTASSGKPAVTLETEVYRKENSSGPDCPPCTYGLLRLYARMYQHIYARDSGKIGKRTRQIEWTNLFR